MTQFAIDMTRDPFCTILNPLVGLTQNETPIFQFFYELMANVGLCLNRYRSL